MYRTALLRRTSLWISTIMMSCFGLTGIVSAQSATITNTGPHSKNSITQRVDNSCRVSNNNDVTVDNVNVQNAQSGNATVGGNSAYWSGWDNMNPDLAQSNGSSFGDWWGGVDNYMDAHSDSSKWDSANDNTSWAPADSSWGSWDPALWQANGQSYDNWDGQFVGWMNNNAANRMLTWGGGNTTGGDATTGDATNVNNTTTNISIDNSFTMPTPLVATPSNPCGVAAPSLPGGGMGGGGNTWAPSGSSYSAPARSYGGSGGGSGYYSSYKPAAKPVSAPAVQQSAPSAPANNTPTPPAGGSGGGSAPAGNTISNTGPHSTNTIDTSTSNCVTVTNNNNVGVSNVNVQSAQTGNASSSSNTTGGGAGSGDASNGNGAGTGVGLSN